MKRVMVLLGLVSLVSLAAGPFQNRDKALTERDGYVAVSLSGLANDTQPLPTALTQVTVSRIPFNLVQENGQPNCLFMKPIGWAAEKDESREYPGYIAKYDRRPGANDPTRAVVTIPVSDYQSVYVLAATDDDPALTTDLTFRFGEMNGNGPTTYQNFEGTVPRAGDKKVRPGQAGVVGVVKTEHGNLFVVRIPINRVFAQDYAGLWALDLDITKKLGIAINQPDPYRFQLRPLGDPSGVRIYAITLERPSMQLEVYSKEPGNVFNQPEKPTFDIIMRNHFEHYRQYHLEVKTVRDDGREQNFVFDEFRNWSGTVRMNQYYPTLELDLTERGYYNVTFQLYRGKELVVERPTTMAILAPNTRKYRSTSPYGAWDFGGGHNTPGDIDLTGPLAVKAGWHYMRQSEKYGLEPFNDLALHGKNAVENLLKKQEEDPSFEGPKRGLIFHETSISGPHVIRTPDLFSGKTYVMSEKDQERWDALWKQANDVYAAMHEHFPKTQLYLGNGMPHLIEEFCRRGIRHDYMTIAGNESGSFMRPPETQPTDIVANNSGLFMFRQILDHYGYQDTKLYQCFEVCYPNTNPGNLTYRTQAAYYARHILHSLSWRVPLIRFGCVTDMGNSYYHSNWGASGFCFGYPRVSPKPSYVAYAVLTQVLDGATFVRQVPTGTTTVYAFEFKMPAGDYVTALWTPRGSRDLTVKLPRWSGSKAVATAMLGRETELPIEDRSVSLTIGSEVTYLRTKKPSAGLELGAAAFEPPPAGERFTISELNDLGAWEILNQSDFELETYNFMKPRKQGDFAYSLAADVDGRQNVVEVMPKPVTGGTEYMQMYSSLKLKQPVEIPGFPTELGLWVNGNGSWGRVIFELTDASGQRWISIGDEMGGAPNPWMADWMPKEKFEELQSSGKAGVSDWNSNDAWGRSNIDHEGWRYVKFPLPGQFGTNHDGYHWPYASQWHYDKDGVVHYPLTFTRLTVTLPEKTLYGTEWKPVKRPQVYLGPLQATYVPAEEAFVGE